MNKKKEKDSKKLTIEDVKELFLSQEAEEEFRPEGSPSLQEIQEQIKSGKLKIKLASALHVNDLDNEIDQVLDAFNIGSALITDMSRVSDFRFEEDEIKDAALELGIDISEEDYIYQVAQRLRDHQN